MTIIEQTIDLAGKIRMIVQLTNGEIIPLKFSTQPSTTQLNEIEVSYIVAHQYDSVQTVTINLSNHYELIREFVTLVKQNPSVTLTQYNNWLTGKQWYEAAVIRFFVYKLAMGLASHAEVSLTGLTESFVLGKVRDWFVNTPTGKIERVVFNI